MGKILRFKWVPSISLSEEYKGILPDSFLYVIETWTERRLDQLVEAAKSVEHFSKVKVTTGNQNNVVFSGMTTPIQLIRRLNIPVNRNEYEISDEGPSLEWLLKYEKELSNPNPNKVFYTNNMAVSFSSDPYNVTTVTIAILNTKHIDTYIRTLEYECIEGLDIPLNEFLESYGYTDESTYENIAKIVLTFQVAKKLGFINAEEVVTHFNDKHLVADLKLKGVLEYVETFCL